MLSKQVSGSFKSILFPLVAGFIILIACLIVQSNNVYALDEHNCLSCHSDMNINKTNADGHVVSLKISENDVNSAAHRFIDCTTCHTYTPHKTPPEFTKQSVAEKCGTCHQYEYEQYANSIHGQKAAQNNNDVATCTDCHSDKGDAHSITRVLQPDAPTYKKNIAETCAKCHDDEALMKSYGIVEKVYETYMVSYHGKALQMSTNDLTQMDAATCTNCHGTHNIQAVDNPGSPVAGMENLVQTCQQCHTGADAEFAKGFLGHKAASSANVPAALYVEKSFTGLLFAVLGFGVLVLIGAIFGYSRKKWRR